jgi:hypothetical protein
VPTPGDIGRTFAPVTAKVEAGRFDFFLKTTGETNPLYRSEAAARSAGYRGRPVPPTYLFCLEMMDAPNPFAFLEELGIDLAHLLHAEQRFDYRAPACVGDSVTFLTRVTDVFEKKGGALTFTVLETSASAEGVGPVATLRKTLVVREPEAGS